MHDEDELRIEIQDAPELRIADVLGEQLHLSQYCPLCHREGKVWGKWLLHAPLWIVLMQCGFHDHTEQFWVMMNLAQDSTTARGIELEVTASGPDPSPSQVILTPADMLRAVCALPDGVLAQTLTDQQRERLMSEFGLHPFWLKVNPHNSGWMERIGSVPAKVMVSDDLTDEIERLRRHGYQPAWLAP